MFSFLKKYSLVLFPLLAMLVWACTTSDSETDQYLTWNLSEAYKAYDTVSIKLVDAKDPTLVYEVVWNDRIPDPAHFPKYKLTVAKDKDFTIQIRCYNAKHELLLSKDVSVVGSKPQTSVVLMPDVRLFGLAAAPGVLAPVFDPNTFSYKAQVDPSFSSLTLTATPVDAGNVLTVDQKVSAWGTGIPLDLQAGANVIEVTVSTKDGKASQNYELVVTRGKDVPPDSVLSVSLQDKSLVLFIGDGPTGLKADVNPAGALLQWVSLDEAVVRVDGSGRLTPVAPGAAKVVVKAGNFADTADVTVKVNIQTTDTTPPNAPLVNGTTPTNTAPKWTWSTGGGGGSGTYRYKLGDSTLAGAVETKDLTYTLTTAPVTGTAYKLYVAERDSAGNWSPSAGYAILYDLTKPSVAILTPQASGTYLTKNATVAFSGTASGPNTIVKVSYKINAIAAADAVFDKGAWTIPSVPALEGSITIVTIVATDNLGNTGEASLSLVRDNTPPGLPVISASPATPTSAVKGSWGWGPGSDGANGSGLNGNYRYSTDGGATWKETTATLVNDLPLAEGNNSFALQEQDMAGNWSASASKPVVSDITGPKLAVTSPAAGATVSSIHVTVTGTVSDAATNAQTVSIAGQVSGSGNAVITGGTWTSGDLVLKAGPDTLIITATDAVGNPTKATLFLTVSVATPQVAITYPPRGFITNKDTVTLKYKVDNGAETSALQNLTKEGAILLTATSPKNEAGLAGTDTLTLIRDITLPGFPTVTLVKTPTNADPTWNFTSAVDNAGGSGIAAYWYYKISDKTSGALLTSGYVTSPTFTWANAADGAYNFVVQQQDKAGNWGAYSGISTVTVDKTKPVVTVTSPLDNFVTNKATVPLVCNVGGTDKAAIGTALPLEGPNTVTCTSTDSAGNTGTKSITVIRRSNVLFVKPGGGVGTPDGSSWVFAYSTIRQAEAKAVNGTEIWVAGGTYNQDPGDTGLVMRSGLSLYGGFNPATGTSTALRTFGPKDTTFLNGDGFNTIMTISGASAASQISNVTVDGFSFKQVSNVAALSIGYGTGITLRNLQFVPPAPGSVPSAVQAGNATFTMDNCLFGGYKTEEYIFSTSNVNMTMNYCTFTGNQFYGESDNAWIYLDGPSFTFTNTKFLDDPGTGGPTYRDIKFTTAGTMTFTNPTFHASSKDVGLILTSTVVNTVNYNNVTWISP